MPAFAFPDLPNGLGLYGLWITFDGILIYLLRLLGDSHGFLKERAEKETEGRLPSLNEYLWRLIIGSSEDPYNALESAGDLMSILDRIQRAGKQMIRHRRLRKHTEFGYLACAVGILAAFVCGAIYITDYVASDVASRISYIVFGILTAWSLWHLGNVSFRHFIIVKGSDED